MARFGIPTGLAHVSHIAAQIHVMSVMSSIRPVMQKQFA